MVEWVCCDGLIEQPNRFFELAPMHRERAAGGEHLGIVRSELNRPIQEPPGGMVVCHVESVLASPQITGRILRLPGQIRGILDCGLGKSAPYVKLLGQPQSRFAQTAVTLERFPVVADDDLTTFVLPQIDLGLKHVWARIARRRLHPSVQHRRGVRQAKALQIQPDQRLRYLSIRALRGVERMPQIRLGLGFPAPSGQKQSRQPGQSLSWVSELFRLVQLPLRHRQITARARRAVPSRNALRRIGARLSASDPARSRRRRVAPR